jgi:hypothetical protein
MVKKSGTKGERGHSVFTDDSRTADKLGRKLEGVEILVCDISGFSSTK